MQNNKPEIPMMVLAVGLIVFGLFAPRLTYNARTMTTMGLPAMLLILLSGLSLFFVWIEQAYWLGVIGLVALSIGVADFVSSWWAYENAHDANLQLWNVSFPDSKVPLHEFIWPPLSFFVEWGIIFAGISIICARGLQGRRQA